ncbi:MAG TPA: hypothetical protein VJZ91_04560 [Blastocatellia bacterium]|nr:hypothetical protein [Blastocatellia bacterium]
MQPDSQQHAAAARLLARLALALLALIGADRVARAQTPTPTPPWVESGTNIISTNDGNVGIGTPAPTSKLDVSGTAAVSGDFKAAAGRLKFSFGGPEGYIQGNTERLSFWTTNGSGGQAARMRFGGNSAISITEFLNTNVTIGGVVPAAHAATNYNSLWLKNNVALMSEVANGYSIIKLASNYQRNGGQWSHVDTSLPAWVLDMGSGPNWDQFSVSRTPANPAAGAAFSPVALFNINSSGNVGIGTPAPGYRLDVQGGQVNASGGLCINGVCKTDWSQIGGQWATPGSLIGLGSSTLSPWAAHSSVLESVNTSVFFGKVTDLHLVSNAYNDSTGWKYKTANTAANYYLYQGAHRWRVAPAGAAGAAINWIEAMTISNSGNVGVGTLNPLGRFHVSGASSSAAVRYYISDMSGAADRKHWIFENYLGDLYFSRVDDNNIGNIVARMMISNSGNVGIGTPSPGYRLDVQGGQVNASGGLCINGVCKTDWSQIGGQWSGTGNITYNSGNVGIGTNTPNTAKLVIGGAAGADGLDLSTSDQYANLRVIRNTNGSLDKDLHLQWGAGAGSKIHLYSNNSESMTLAGGNVGIGIASPLEKLSVNGTIHVNRLGTPGAAELRIYNGGSVAEWAFRQASGASHDLQISKAVSGVYSDFLTINTAGNIGVGTALPNAKVDVTTANANDGIKLNGSTNWAMLGTNFGNGSYNNLTRAGDRGIVYGGAAPGNQGGGFVIVPWMSAASGIRLDPSGNVGVGADLNVSGAITGATINATYQDVAEWVPSTQKLAAGTVVVLDADHNNHVLASSKSYDTRVAGVVSAQPGLILGQGGDDKLKVATTGRVKVQVDATRASILVGDLLVTSDVEGVAMKSIPVDLGGTPIHRPGTIIGKALEPLASGTGEILVLLSLQ